MVGYPYTYGDNGPEFTSKFTVTQVLIIALFSSGSIFMLPSLASAVNATEVLERIDAMLIANEATLKASNSGGPISAAACVISGVCIHNAYLNVKAGKPHGAAGYLCGAAMLLCGQHAAKSKGL